MKFAGKNVAVKASGSAVATTGLAMTDKGDHLTYTATDAIRSVWSRQGAVTVKVDGSTVTSGYTIDRLFGRVTFDVAQAPAAVVTVDVSYLPMSTIAKAHDFEIQLSATSADSTTFDSDGWTERTNVLLDAQGSISRFHQVDNLFIDVLLSGDVVCIEFWRTKSTLDCRVWGILAKHDAKASVASLVDAQIDYEGSADADGRSVSYA